MNFSERLIIFRKEQRLTQQELANKIGMHVLQIRRYEAGKSQPTLEVIKNLALVLNCKTDDLIFGKEERDTQDELKLQFEALSKFNNKEKEVAKILIEALILRNNLKKD